MNTKRGALTTEHPDDGAIVRLMDGECAEAERAHVDSHLASCESCAVRHTVLVRHTRQVGELLTMGDAGPHAQGRPVMRARQTWWRTRRVRSTALRAAVLLIAVGVVGAGAQTLRPWVRAHWPEVRRLLRPPPSRHEVAPATTAAVHFVPDGAKLLIDVVAHQPAGTMVVDVVADTLATTLITPSTSDAAVLILPGVLRIANRGAAATSYVIHVPSRVNLVELRIASQKAIRLTVVPGARWVVDLRAPGQ